MRSPNSAPSSTSLASTSKMSERQRWPRGSVSVQTVLLAIVAFVPLLLTRRGVSTPDTKTYLYLNPSRFLSQVASMWDPSVGAGTVTHQYIGYLFPMGPFFWSLHALSVPLWVAQRLWLGVILFAAGTGVGYLCRRFAFRGPAALVAGLMYMLSPYLLQYAGRISVILLPWAALPWLVAFSVMALRRGGWRYPALFAIVVALVSSMNASSIIYVGFAPVLWILYALLVEREATTRQVLATVTKIGVLTLGVSLWWILGLAVEAGFGVNVLKYTETVYATSGSSNSSEIMRGLGYWYFYGFDRLGPWTHGSVVFSQQLRSIAVSFGPPLLALIAAMFVRWKARAYFVLLVVVGMAWSVGAHPYDNPTPFGSLLKVFMTKTTAGLAMRSTDRASPLVILGLSMLLAAMLAALWRRLPKTSVGVACIAAIVVLANAAPIARGDIIANNFSQPDHLPKGEMDAIRYLNGSGNGTRVLALPGNGFASFRWGNTVDAPQPAFLNRPFLIHEQQVMGSMATADMLYALDGPIQQSTANPAAIAPIARLLSVGNLLVQYDTQYEHFGQPHPLTVASLLTPTPQGLTGPVSFGKPTVNRSTVSTLDEQDLASMTPAEKLPKVAVYGVNDPRPILRAESTEGAIVVAGDGAGLVNLAPTGLLGSTSSVIYSGSLADHPAKLRSLMARGAGLVITDSNRKQGFRWDTISSTAGATETRSEDPRKTDPTDAPIDLFPAAGFSAKTMASYIGASAVRSSTYGSPFSFIPEDRAFSALDGNLDTAWRTGIFENPRGEWWKVRFTNAVTTDHLTLVQPLNGSLTRWLTKVGISFDGGPMERFTLGQASRTAGGQILTFPERSFKNLKITILHTSNDKARGSAASEVGLAEVQIPGHSVVEVISMPTDLTRAAGATSIANRLTVAMTRWRSSPYPTRFDAEPTLDRVVSLPTARVFQLSGGATMSTLIPDDQIDRLLGQTPGSSGQVDAYSSGRLPGSLHSRASTTLDHDASTYWQPGFGTANAKDSWLQYNLASPIEISHLPLTIVNDSRHSVPTSVRITTQNGSRTVAIPELPDLTTPGSSTTIDLNVSPPILGSQVRLTFPTFRIRASASFNTTIPLAQPIGIAEVGLPNVILAPVPSQVPGTCRGDLLTIDGHRVDVSIVGSTADALRLRPLSIVPCGNSINGIPLGAGRHVIETALGHQDTTGWNLDQVTLDSAPGGAPGPPATNGQIPATQPGLSPTVKTELSTTSGRLHASGVTGPFTVVLGESINAGWHAEARLPRGADAAGRSIDLGDPSLIDGYANSWDVSDGVLRKLGGGSIPSDVVITLTWAPQQRIWAALAVSSLALLVCFVLVLLPRRRRRRSAAEQDLEDAEISLLTRRQRIAAAKVPGHGSSDLAASSPEFITPLTPGQRRPAFWSILLASLVTGAVAGALASPLAGCLVAFVVALSLSVRHLRALPGLGALGFFIASVVNILILQRKERFGPGDWPNHFTTAGALMWVAIVLLGADAVVAHMGSKEDKSVSRTEGESVDNEPAEPEVLADQKVEATSEQDPALAGDD